MGPLLLLFCFVSVIALFMCGELSVSTVLLSSIGFYLDRINAYLSKY